MKYLICLLFIACTKEMPCGKVIGKPSYNIHSNFLDVDYGECVLRVSVDLKTYTFYKIGDKYCQ